MCPSTTAICCWVICWRYFNGPIRYDGYASLGSAAASCRPIALETPISITLLTIRPQTRTRSDLGSVQRRGRPAELGVAEVDHRRAAVHGQPGRVGNGADGLVGADVDPQITDERPDEVGGLHR